MKVDLERKYYAKNKVLNVVFEEIKQRIKAKTTKLQKYNERNNNLYKTGCFKPTINSCLKKLRRTVEKMMWNPLQKKIESFGAIFAPKM